MFRNLLLAASLFLLSGNLLAQASRSAAARANEAIASAVAMLAAGDPGNAVHTLDRLAGTTSDPYILHHARCVGGAAMAMNVEVRASEEIAGMLNRPVPAAQQGGMNVTLAECIRELSGISQRVTIEKRAGLFYFLGLIGTDEAEHIRYLREALKARADFGEAAYQLGVHLMAQGEMEEASRLFRRVADQHPEWAEPRANLGILLNLTGKPADAARELREAIKIRPDYPEAHGQLGMALYGAGELDEALAECGRAARSEPDNPTYYGCAAVVLIEKNRGADALAYARRASDLAPAHETFLVVLAAAQSDAGQPNDALATMRRAIASQPRLKSDPSRLEKADLLRGRALTLASQLVQKVGK